MEQTITTALIAATTGAIGYFLNYAVKNKANGISGFSSIIKSLQEENKRLTEDNTRLSKSISEIKAREQSFDDRLSGLLKKINTLEQQLIAVSGENVEKSIQNTKYKIAINCRSECEKEDCPIINNLNTK